MIELVVWAYLAYSDLKTRTVSNIALAILFFVGVGTLNVSVETVVGITIGMLVLWPLAYFLYTTTDIGGADVKVLLILPVVYPENLVVFLVGTLLGSLPYYGSKDIPYMVPYLIGALTVSITQIL